MGDRTRSGDPLAGSSVKVAITVIGVCAVVLFCASWSGNEIVRWITVGLTAVSTALLWIVPRAAAPLYAAALLVSGYTVVTTQVSPELSDRILGIDVQGPLQQAGWLLLIALILFTAVNRPVPLAWPALSVVIALLLGWGWSELMVRSAAGKGVEHTTASAKPTATVANWTRRLPKGLYGSGVLVPGRNVAVELRDRSERSTSADQGLFVTDASTGAPLWQYSLTEQFHFTQVMVDPEAGILFARIRRAALFFDLMTGELRHRLDLAELQRDSTFVFVREAGENRPPIRIGSVALLNASKPGVSDDAVYALDVRTRTWREVVRGANAECADHWVRGPGAVTYFVRNACADATVEVIRLDGLAQASRTKVPVRPDDRRCQGARPCRLFGIAALDDGVVLHTSDSGERESQGLIWLRADGSVGARLSIGDYAQLIPLRELDNSRSRVVVSGEGFGQQVLEFRDGALTRGDAKIRGSFLGTANGVLYLGERNVLRALDVRAFEPRGADATIDCAPRYATVADGRVLISCDPAVSGDISLVALPAR
ncbi:hypothetical protein [Allokutzneria albata]|uniref:Uncharacterized protein n=1 Tax=Allokutzneria albata TaxID=211114 RepID=A0A1G9ZQD5_ALLAB|nr:hypothetical protein [Allokutzneria albata]SDN23335.1 hypothetical protein SAMN04489726_5640 [Allokutzneria albata]